jgi:hypothetical protein
LSQFVQPLLLVSGLRLESCEHPTLTFRASKPDYHGNVRSTATSASLFQAFASLVLAVIIAQEDDRVRNILKGGNQQECAPRDESIWFCRFIGEVPVGSDPSFPSQVAHVLPQAKLSFRQESSPTTIVTHDIVGDPIRVLADDAIR